MNKERKTFSINRVFLAVAAVITVCFLLAHWDSGKFLRSKPLAAGRNAISIGRAIFFYYDHYSFFPYDSRGSDYALSQLHGFLIDESQWPSVFDSPDDKGTHAVYRPSEQRIVGSDFIYLNPPPGTWPEDGDALLWERKDIREKGRFLVLLDYEQGFNVVFEEKATVSPKPRPVDKEGE